MISYSKILKQAYAILRTHKFLWGLGLFLFWDLGANVLSYGFNEQEGQTLDKVNVSVPMLLIGVLFGILFVQLFFRARAGVISGTKSVLDKKPLGFSKAFSEGGKYHLRIFGIWLFSVAVLVLAGIILAAPVGYLYSINYQERASLLGIFALLIFVPLAVVMNFANNLAPLYVVIYDMKIRPAFAASLDMIKKFWIVFLIFTLWLGLISFAAGFIVFLILAPGVVFLVGLLYNTAGIHITFGSVLLGILGSIAFLFFAGAIASFQQIAWVLLFEKIVRPQKIEEEEALPVPEIIS